MFSIAVQKSCERYPTKKNKVNPASVRPKKNLPGDAVCLLPMLTRYLFSICLCMLRKRLIKEKGMTLFVEHLNILDIIILYLTLTLTMKQRYNIP